ncbi:MAG: CotH kinase family protein [Butyrivibrio sp.]|nr:CotH kinase family protein [Butyrivibrio sp.]
MKNIKKKDLIVIIVSIIAVIILAAIIIFNRKVEEAKSETLTQVAQSQSESETTEITSGTGVLINEVNQSGSIEILNNTRNQLDISGYVVYVNEDMIEEIPEGTVLEGGTVYVVTTGTEFAENEALIISLFKDDSLIKALTIPGLSKGVSYGCITDGSNEMTYLNSSIGESNTEENVIESDDLSFSVPGGFYSSGFDLSINVPEGTKVYYTTDGTVPTTDSELYSQAITIVRPSSTDFVYSYSDGGYYVYNSSAPDSVDRATVVSAIAVDSTGETVAKLTQSYFIGYVGDSYYENLPVISITADPNDLFGYEDGIYVNGKLYDEAVIQGQDAYYIGNYVMAKSISAQMEYYEANKDKTFTSNIILSVYQDESVTNAQKSLKIAAPGATAKGSSIESFIHNSEGSFVLSSGRTDSSKIRALLVKSLLEGTSLDMVDIKPCIVFIDGEYWGLYLMQGNYDNAFFKENYEVEDEIIKVENDYEIPEEYTEFYNYVVNTDFTVDANYSNVQKLMDVENYVEYICANVFIGNTVLDKYKAAVVWRTESSSETEYGDGRWRWLLGSVESSLDNPYSRLGNISGSFSYYTLNTFLTDGVKENPFLLSLMQNDDFRELFADTMKTMVEEVLTLDNELEVVKELDTLLSKAMSKTANRFNSTSGLFETTENRIYNFFLCRPEFIVDYAEEFIENKGIVGTQSVESETEETEDSENEGEAGTQETDSNLQVETDVEETVNETGEN